jgi:hypothetical protein
MSAVLASEFSPWIEYELLKAKWIEDNPVATPEQYQQAIQRIAKKCGV